MLELRVRLGADQIVNKIIDGNQSTYYNKDEENNIDEKSKGENLCHTLQY
jgi:hypothetical protein